LRTRTRPDRGVPITKRIVLIQGHPDCGHRHFGHALAEAYSEAARAAGIEVRSVDVAALDFPMLRAKEEWATGQVPECIRESQDAITRADHLVLFYPLWLGDMPALVKAYLEQVFRPGFAMQEAAPGRLWKKLLTGRSARIVVTMGMPGWYYRWFYFAHSLKSLKRNILAFSGIGPIRDSVIGTVESPDARHRESWLAEMRKLGARGK